MKTITMIFLLMSFWALNSFSQNEDVTGLLGKPETRTEIYRAILNDHQLMMEFMNEMKSSDHAMMMMKENASGKEPAGNTEMGDSAQMMGNSMGICKMDSTMCQGMANMTGEHPNMMQMCMQSMKENDKMAPGCKMNAMDSNARDVKSEHHRHQ